MSEYKKGDRVKVTIEGTVTYVSSYRHGFDVCTDGGAKFAIDRDADVTIEKLPDPLPTTPGSVIRYRTDGTLRFRTADGQWLFDRDGERWDDVAMAHPRCYDILFDAGKTS